MQPPRLIEDRPGTPLRRIPDALLGYDVFISYAWSDGRAFAVATATLLRNRGWRVFLDDAEMPGGAELAPTLGTSLRRSSALIVVVTDGAIASKHVAAEIETFGRTAKPVVPVFVDRVASCDPSLLLERLTRRIFIERRGALPDDGFARQIESSLRFVRRSRIRATAATTIAVIMLLLAGVAFYQRGKAKRSAYEIGLDLTARQVEDKLSTSEQATALSIAVANTMSAKARLGSIPTETWRSLWLAYEGAREVWRLSVPLGTSPALFAPSGHLISETPDGHLLGLGDNNPWRAPTKGLSLLPSGRAVLIQHQAEGSMQIRGLNGRLWYTLDRGQSLNGLIDASANGSTLVRSPDAVSIFLKRSNSADILLGMPLRSPLQALRISRNGDLVTAIASDGTVAWLKPGTLTPIRVAAGTGDLAAVAISDDGSRVALLIDSQVKIVSANPTSDSTFVPTRPGTQLQAPTLPERLAVANNGRVAISYGNSGAVLIFDANGRSPVPPLLGSESPLAAINADGTRIGIADQTQKWVREFDLSERNVRSIVNAGRPGEQASSLASCVDGRFLIWGGIAGALRVTDLAAPKPYSWSLKSPHDRVAAIACTAGGAATADQNGRVFAWNDLSATASPTQLPGEARLLAYHKGVLAGVGTDRITFWRPDQSSASVLTIPFAELDLKQGNTTAIEFFADGDLLLATDGTATADGLVSIAKWTVPINGLPPTRRWRRSLPGLLLVHSSSAAEGSHRLFVAGVLDSVYSVDDTGAVERLVGGILRPAGESIVGLSNGRLAVASTWGALAVLDDRGRRLITPTALTEATFRLATNSRGDRLFAAGSDGSVREVLLAPAEIMNKICKSPPYARYCEK